MSRELAELGRRADQLAHQLRNLRYRLVCRKIGLIESNTRCRHLKQFTCKGQVYLPEAPSGFCLGLFHTCGVNIFIDYCSRCDTEKGEMGGKRHLTDNKNGVV